MSVPNRELLTVWKRFILDNLNTSVAQVRTLFDKPEEDFAALEEAE